MCLSVSPFWCHNPPLWCHNRLTFQYSNDFNPLIYKAFRLDSGNRFFSFPFWCHNPPFWCHNRLVFQYSNDFNPLIYKAFRLGSGNRFFSFPFWCHNPPLWCHNRLTFQYSNDFNPLIYKAFRFDSGSRFLVPRFGVIILSCLYQELMKCIKSAFSVLQIWQTIAAFSHFLSLSGSIRRSTPCPFIFLPQPKHLSFCLCRR